MIATDTLAGMDGGYITEAEALQQCCIDDLDQVWRNQTPVQVADFADSGQPFRKVADTRFGKSRTALGVKIEEPCFVQG